jgi:hypothetical protein
MISFLRAVFYWTYERGSWQWDIACLVFIVIIFATPPDFLEGYTRHPLAPGEIRQLIWAFLTGSRG